MTPELAVKLSRVQVDPDLYARMSSIYQDYSAAAITAVIGKLRAEQELVEIDPQTLNIYDETITKPTENVNQGPEKRTRRKAASKTHTEQDL